MNECAYISKTSKSHLEMLIYIIPFVYTFLLIDVNPLEFFMKSNFYVNSFLIVFHKIIEPWQTGFKKN